ncbi:MAG: proline iminopeptidase, partial [Saprospiraceae bacterium]
MKSGIYFLLFLALIYAGCTEKSANTSSSTGNGYMDYTGQDDQKTGGIRMIPITTAKGTFNVWTKRVGNNPRMKVLLLHGGPGGTHEFFENFDGYLPKEGI